MLGEGDYSGKHSAPSRDAAPLHDLTREVPEGGQVFPDDVYTHMRYYQFHEAALERKAERVIRAARGKPNAMVTIYRALPAGMTKINPGDWVTIVKDYAMSHAIESGPNGEDWPVIAAKVKAKDLHTNGDSLMEWGYNGAGSVSASVVETRMKPRGVLLFEAGYDVTAGPKERARREKAERERQAHHAAQKAKYGDDPNAPAQDAHARAAAKRAARRAAKKPVQEADVDIRELERQAAQGDADAKRALLRARQRTGYAVYGYTQSGKPMRADSSLAGSRSQRVVVSPWLAQSVSGWSPQDIADAYALTKLYSKKRAKDKRWGTRGSPDRFAPETLGFTKQSGALHDLLRQHPDVVAASAKFDRHGFPGSGIGHAAVEYTDAAERHYKNFFRKDPGKKMYMQSYFGGEMTEAAAPRGRNPRDWAPAPQKGTWPHRQGSAYADGRDMAASAWKQHPLSWSNIRNRFDRYSDIPGEWYDDDFHTWYVNNGSSWAGPYSSKGRAAEAMLRAQSDYDLWVRRGSDLSDPEHYDTWRPNDRSFLTIVKPYRVG